MNSSLDLLLGHPPHALLLDGLSASDAAEAFATRLLGGSHTYLKVILPTDSTISIDQIRELLAFFQLKVPGRRAVKRAAVLSQAETMTTEAQNALLKLLEEPPADSVLILASARPQELLATVRSRVQTVHLTEAEPVPDSESVQLVRQVLAGSTFERLCLVDGGLKDKKTARTFVDALETVAAASLSAAAQNGRSTERWQRVLKAAYGAQDAFEHNGNAKLVLTDLMLSL